MRYEFPWYCVALKKAILHFMLALFRLLCWCFMPWLYSWLYIEALYHGFILGFILGFMSLGRGVSVASVASGAVVATAGAHRGERRRSWGIPGRPGGGAAAAAAAAPA